MTKKQEAYFELNNEEMEVEDWASLTEEEIFELKEAFLSTKYGTGGEHLNLFPNLVDPGKLNYEFNGEYIEKLPKTISQRNLKQFKGNGKIDIIKIDSLNHSHYLIILLPQKTIEIDLWAITMNDKPPYTKYREGKKLKTIKVTKSKYHISNIFSNGGKALNQAKRLSYLLGLGDTSIKSLEQVKKGNRNYYMMDIKETGEIILKNGYNGPSYNSLDELLGRRHTIDLNIMEFIG